MSKKADEAAKKAYPSYIGIQKYFSQGYEQGSKEMIDRAAAWIRAHWREYIMGPDKDGSIGFGHWENDFREAMKDK